MSRAAALALTVALTAAAASAQPGKVPKTLAYADAPILAFAHDGRNVAWISRKNCLGAVRVRDLAAKTQAAVGAASDGQCEHVDESRLALGGALALWSRHETGNEVYAYVLTGTRGRKQRLVGQNVHDQLPYPIGDHLGAVAGGGGAVVWSKVAVSVRGPEDCDINGTCRPYVKGGAVYRARARSTKIPGAPPSVLLATDGTRLALLPAELATPNPRAKANGMVQVRRLATGALIGTFLPTSLPKGLAILGARVAVLTKNAVEYRSGAGALLWEKTVPARAASISLSPLGIVFRVGRTIRGFTATGRPFSVAVARGAPIGLSASGRRVAWAENVPLSGRLTGRIQAVELS